MFACSQLLHVLPYVCISIKLLGCSKRRHKFVFLLEFETSGVSDFYDKAVFCINQKKKSEAM